MRYMILTVWSYWMDEMQINVDIQCLSLYVQVTGGVLFSVCVPM